MKTFKSSETLIQEWKNNPRWQGVTRHYTAAKVVKLRGTLPIAHTLAEQGAQKLWRALQDNAYINALGALSGNQAMQMARVGLKAIYLSGWQVAADANTAETMYPDQSLYPVDSVPAVVRKINNAFKRADEITSAEGNHDTDWFVPIVADAESGFGGNLNAFELTKALIVAGASAVHFEDQLSSAKKCGHMGGKVLVPTQEAIQKLMAVRLASDTMDVPTLIIARTDAQSAALITSDIDERDHAFIEKGARTAEGFYRLRPGIQQGIARALAYAPVSDLLWVETNTPNLDTAKQFAEAVHKQFPDKMLAYNCSPSFNWKRHLDNATIAKFQRELGAMGYKFQFITLAGFHALNHGMFDLARRYKTMGMQAYVTLQEREFADEAHGYTATKHQREVGASYFDAVNTAITGGTSSTQALAGSTEAEQF